MSEQVDKQKIIEENRSHDKDTGSSRSANRIAYLPDCSPYGTFKNSPQGLSLPQRIADDGSPPEKITGLLEEERMSATRQLSRNSACVAKLVPSFPILVFNLSNSKPRVARVFFPTSWKQHGTFVPERHEAWGIDRTIRSGEWMKQKIKILQPRSTKMKQKHNVTAEKLGIQLSSGTLAGSAVN